MRRILHDQPVVLVVTDADDPTADLVIAELNRRGQVGIARINPADFPHALRVAADLDIETGQWTGSIVTTTREVDLATVRAVYWRRPAPYRFPGLDPQAAGFAAAQARAGLGGVLAGLTNCRYVNHPHRNRAAEYKPAQLASAVGVGFDVPQTLITSDADAARRFVHKHAPAIYKPLRLTDIQRDGVPLAFWTERIAPEDLDDSVGGTAHLFQAEVAGKIADLRITVVGERIYCVRIESFSGLLDWRQDYDDLSYQEVDPPGQLVSMMRAYLARFGLEFGCFDFAVAPTGTPYFLECNPNGQWAWLETPTGMPMTAAFADLLDGTR